jgi:hypothetical protein
MIFWEGQSAPLWTIVGAVDNFGQPADSVLRAAE